MSKNKKIKFSWINALLSAILVLAIMFIINNLNSYGKLQKNIFLALNIGVGLFLLAVVFFTVKVNNSDNKNLKFAYTGFLIVCLAFSAYGFYVLDIVDGSIKDITVQEKVTERHAAFVVKKDTYKDVEQLKGKTVGIIKSEDFIEGHAMPIDELKKLEYEDVKQKEYASYPLLINALLKDEVDFISLPKEYATLYVTDEQIAPDLDKLSTVHTYSGKYENVSIISGSDIDVTTVPFTMLIMGNDGGRTDSLMLATVNPNSLQITLTSIARDSYVPIACYPDGHRDKINHARTISRDCTIKTVENLLDIQIDFFVEVSFDGLVDLVDALGTIPIDSPGSFNGNIERNGETIGGVYVEEGLHDLNGNQVLAFVRERKSFTNGDFQRQQNQQQAIASLIATVAETRSVDTLLNLVKATGKNVDTNLSVPQLIDLMNLAIQRMDSTVLGASDIVTIHGNRITGQGVMKYAPEYGFDLYYYVLYDGSINDAKALIDMNMRADGILDVPKGFNYSIQDEYTPPEFGRLEYYEGVDDSIFKGGGKPTDEDEKSEIEEVSLKQMKGMTRAEAEAYLSSLGFSYNDAGVTIEETDDETIIGIEFVNSDTAGVTLDAEHPVVNLKFIKYVKKEVPKEPEKPTEPETPEEPKEPEDGSGEGGNPDENPDKKPNKKQ